MVGTFLKHEKIPMFQEYSMISTSDEGETKGIHRCNVETSFTNFIVVIKCSGALYAL
jgi:hypothetical protein